MNILRSILRVCYKIMIIFLFFLLTQMMCILQMSFSLGFLVWTDLHSHFPLLITCVSFTLYFITRRKYFFVIYIMPTSCIVVDCRKKFSDVDKNRRKVSLFRLPTDPIVLHKWCDILSLNFNDRSLTKSESVWRAHVPVCLYMLTRHRLGIDLTLPAWIKRREISWPYRIRTYQIEICSYKCYKHVDCSTIIFQSICNSRDHKKHIIKKHKKIKL